jgi:hypothetical protein
MFSRLVVSFEVVRPRPMTSERCVVEKVHKKRRGNICGTERGMSVLRSILVGSWDEAVY